MKGRGRRESEKKNKRNVHGDFIAGSLCWRLASDESLPSLVALVDDFGGILLVLGLTGEGELVLGLAIGDLVDP